MTFAEVMLWGTKIGTVALPDDSNIATFRYDMDFLNSGIELSPITMPLSLMRPFTDCPGFSPILCRTGSETLS